MSKFNQKYILHVDGDSFFASCELASYPNLRGKPVVVGEERGIAVAFTKEAKDLGVTRGMPIFKIKKFYPEVIILPSHFEIYKMYSEKFVSVIRKFLNNVQVYSIDECFAEIPEKYNTKEELIKFIGKIKAQTQKETGITFSFGVARTKVLAKVASKAQKPDGLTVITEKDEEEYLKNTPIGKVWGIGYRTAPKLKMKGITNALIFRDLPEKYVEKNFSKPFMELWLELNGTEIYKVGEHHEDSKTLQATRTFTPALSDEDKVFSELSRNIEIVFSRMRNEELFTNIAYIFIKTSEFKYISAEIKFDFFTQNPADVIEKIRIALNSIWKGGLRYRATGITLGNLRPKSALTNDLFGEQRSILRKGKIMDAIDHIRHIYGNNALILGGSLSSLMRRKNEGIRENLGKSRQVYQFGLPFPFLGEVA